MKIRALARDPAPSQARARSGTAAAPGPRSFRPRLVAAIALVTLALAGHGEGAAADQGRSWKYLTEKLVADGLDRRKVERVFDDPRFGTFRGISFSLNPVESRARYRAFRTSTSIARARRCRERYSDAFEHAERTYGVPASVLAALLHVETQCGEFTGRSRILPGLARLAMANEPANLARNLNRHTHGLAGNLARQADAKTRERGRYLEDTFYPEVLGTFRLSERLGLDPLEIKGSGSGAFGLPQFLPTSFLRFAVDANGNGRVSLFEPDDAISSCANYLVGYGWRRGISRSEQRTVIWGYNHSDAYVDTVLMLSDAIAAARPSSRR